MAKESEDEEYLDNLLNSVTNEKDDWLENELNNMDDFADIDSNIDDNIDTDKMLEEATTNKDDTKAVNAKDDIHKSDTKAVNAKDNIYKGDVKAMESKESMHKDDEYDIDIDDIAGSEDEKLEDLMKLLDSYDAENESDTSNTADEKADNNKKSDEKPSEKAKTDVKDNPKDKPKKKSKEKKESFIKRLFSKNKKDTTEDKNSINADEILNETGSAFDDMEKLALDDVGIDEKHNNLFADIESLDDIPEVDNKKKKKEKKKKDKKAKVKKPKAAKPKKVKVKKEKIPSKDEYIKIPPLFIVFAFSVVAVFILAVYLGANVFSYSSNIDKASNYYVEKKYEDAYNILAGMDIKEEDKNFYNQVENIMKVQKYINDFETYMELEMYVYALESLVKGTASFDSNLNRASELGTYDILVEKSNEIDSLLKNYFNMSIEEARTLNQIINSVDFSRAIYDRAGNLNSSSKEGN